jgi:uncharacterized protein (DUF302 family)
MSTNFHSPGTAGIISKQSKYSVKESLDRFQDLLTSKGVTVFARIDQQAEAKKVGMALAAIELLIFGNPAAGTPIMNAVPLSALDMPLKLLAWEDDKGTVWLSYNDPVYLQERYSLPDDLVKKIHFEPLLDQVVKP